MKFKLIVVDLPGKIIFTEAQESLEGRNLRSIDLSSVAKGMYFLAILAVVREIRTLRIVVE